jgi:hypothetical protein
MTQRHRLTLIAVILGLAVATPHRPIVHVGLSGSNVRLLNKQRVRDRPPKHVLADGPQPNRLDPPHAGIWVWMVPSVTVAGGRQRDTERRGARVTVQ